MYIRLDEVATLALLGYIDLKTYTIPNVILLGWMITIISLRIGTTSISHLHIGLSVIIVGAYIPLKHIAKCQGGDVKLYALLALTHTADDAMVIILISMLLSLIPMALGVKNIPLAFTTFLGYITFLFLRMEGMV